MITSRHQTLFKLFLPMLLLLPLLAACNPNAPVTVQATPPPAAAPTSPPVADQDATALPGLRDQSTVEPPAEPAEEPEATPDSPSADAGAEVSPAGNFLRVNFSEPDNIDPQQASFSNEIPWVMLSYLPLMTFDTDLKPIPGAAQSVTLSDDGKIFTFKLRPDQRYSDGEPLTAENFEYAWKRLCDPLVAGEYTSIAFPIVGCEEYYSAFATGGVAPGDEAALQALREEVGVKAVDPNTFEIRLKQPAPYFLNVAALWIGAPVRQDLIEEGGELWWADPAYFVGNGPFQLTEWEHQGRVRWERNEHYVLDKPKFEAIEGPMLTDGNIVFEAYQSGELDIGGAPPEELAALENDPEMSSQIMEVGGSCTSYIGFNTQIAPFDKKEVRQAFAQAINRDGYARDVLSGLGTKALSFIPPDFPGHDPDETRLDYNPEAARQLLASVDFDASQEIKLTYAASPTSRASSEYLASMLQDALGVKVTLDPVDPTVYSSLFKKGAETPPIYTLGWCADYPDPQNWLSLCFQTGGIVAERIGWSNARFDELTKQADGLPIEDPERMKLYLEAQKLLVEEAPVAFLVHPGGPALVQPWVKGLNMTPLDYFPGIFDIDSIEIVTE